MKHLFFVVGLAVSLGAGGGDMLMGKSEKSCPSPYGTLNEMEKKVILEHGTELPFSGKYETESRRGVYACRNCGSPLYVSDDKFDSGCGWPAFDDAIPGRVRRIPDPDGRRIEIRCSRCDGHLGHVFAGEHLTPKNQRYCVNSVSLMLELQENSQQIRRAVFAGGCFWGVEAMMRQLPGVIDAVSGYTGGSAGNPTYRQVCTGKTGHAEAVEIFYDPAKTDFETLCKYFLEIHDPTQKDAQGPDIGNQYRSAIFYLDPEQRKTALSLLEKLRKKGYEVQTQVVPFLRFYNAESEHQDYYRKTGGAPYCHLRQKRFDP